MKNFKIRVKSPEHSKLIQEKLFEMDYKWGQGKIVSYTDKPFLYVQQNGRHLTYGVMENEFICNSDDYTELELVEKISYDLKEIKKIVKVGNLSYYEDELANALKNIKPI